MTKKIRTLAILWVSCSLIMLACKNVENTGTAESSPKEVEIISSQDLASLSKNYQVNPDEALILGKVLSWKNEEVFILEFEKLSSQGFGFSDQLKKGDRLSVVSNKKGEGIKEGQSIVIVVSAMMQPGVSGRNYLLEDVLGAVGN